MVSLMRQFIDIWACAPKARPEGYALSGVLASEFRSIAMLCFPRQAFANATALFRRKFQDIS